MSIILRNKIYIIIYLFAFCGLSKAQFLNKAHYLLDSIDEKTIEPNDRKILDEQITIYHLAKSDTSKANALSSIVENVQDEKIWYRYNDLALKFSIANQKKTTGLEFKEHKGYEALALNNIGYYYSNYSTKMEIALNYYNQALAIQSELKNYDAMIISYSNIANLHQNKGEFLLALDIYKKAIDIDSIVVDKKSFTAPLNNIAQVYAYIGDTANAILNLKKCLSISLNSKDKSMLAHLLHNIGILSLRTNNEYGIASTLKALRIREEIGDKKGQIQSCISLSGCYLTKKNYQECLRYLEKAKLLLNDSKNKFQLALYHNNYANYYVDLKDSSNAAKELETSIRLFQEINNNIEILTAVKALCVIYKNKPHFAIRRLELYDLQLKLETSLQKTETQKRFLKLNYEQSLKVQQTEFKAQQAVKEEKNKLEKKRQLYVIYGVLLILLIVLIFSFFLLKAFTRIKKSNLIISHQKQEVEHQKQIIEEKHKDITDSITYAHRIQSSLIPSPEKINQQYAKISVWFQPRDIVSGDFYWFTKQAHFNVFALADCTGHGVPGAFMSIIGLNQLNTLINEKKLNEPAAILNKLKEGVIASLNANNEHQDKRDGMDMALVFFNQTELHFAGANQSIYILRNNQLLEYKGNKQPIGLSEKTELFTAQTISLQKNDRIFMLSDGLADQFGGEILPNGQASGKKLKIKKLREWFIETSNLSLHQQKQAIAEKINSFKANFEQTDDITLAIIEI